MLNELKNKQGLTETEFLKQYDPNKYDKPSVTTDMAIFTVADIEATNNRQSPEKELQVLLVKRNDHPYLGSWALPGGFVNMNEDLDTAAYREVREETGIDNLYSEQLYTWGEVERDPRMRVLSVSYLSLINKDEVTISAGSDASEVKWFSTKEEVIEETTSTTSNGITKQKLVKLTLTADEETLSATIKLVTTVEGTVIRTTREVVEQVGLSFDHPRIIQYSLERLRNKCEYTNIVFNLMPSLFTLSALQKVYEVILNKPLLKANFRRKIQGMVIETEEMVKQGAFRPSKLYSYNPLWTEEYL